MAARRSRRHPYGTTQWKKAMIEYSSVMQPSGSSGISFVCTYMVSFFMFLALGRLPDPSASKLLAATVAQATGDGGSIGLSAAARTATEIGTFGSEMSRSTLSTGASQTMSLLKRLGRGGWSWPSELIVQASAGFF